MAWILLGAVLVASAFFLLVFQQVARLERRLRDLVVSVEERMARRHGARLVPPGDELRPRETAVDVDPPAAEGATP